MRLVPLTQAKGNLSALVDEVESTHARLCITRRGEAAVVMVARADYDGLIETARLLSRPDEVALLRSADDDVIAGRLTTDKDLGWYVRPILNNAVGPFDIALSPRAAQALDDLLFEVDYSIATFITEYLARLPWRSSTGLCCGLDGWRVARCGPVRLVIRLEVHDPDFKRPDGHRGRLVVLGIDRDPLAA